jgi:hypothetical protein
MLNTLIPVRDRDERVTGYYLAASATPAPAGRPPVSPEDEQRQMVELVAPLTRLSGKSLMLPVSGAMVLDGVLTRFASAEATWVLPPNAFADPATRRIIDRLVSSDFRFGVDHRADGAPLPGRLADNLVGSVQLLDAAQVPLDRLLDTVAKGEAAGVRCCVLNVNDRATRRLLREAGAAATAGRYLPRGGAALADRKVDAAALGTVVALAQYADGRPPDDRLEALLSRDKVVADAVVKAMQSTKLARPGRTLAQMITLVGRDTLLDLMIIAAARLLGEAARDPELALVALRRARAAQRISAVLEEPPHPRACTMAGLLSAVEFALAIAPFELAEQLPRNPLLLDALGARQRGLGEVLDLIDAMEFGWWEEVRGRSALLKASPGVVSDGWTAAWRTACEELGIGRGEG